MSLVNLLIYLYSQSGIVLGTPTLSFILVVSRLHSVVPRMEDHTLLLFVCVSYSVRLLSRPLFVSIPFSRPTYVSPNRHTTRYILPVLFGMKFLGKHIWMSLDPTLGKPMKPLTGWSICLIVYVSGTSPPNDPKKFLVMGPPTLLVHPPLPLHRLESRPSRIKRKYP